MSYRPFSVVRYLLYPLALIYGAVVWLRNRLYDTGFFSAVEFSVPVISVGNLSAGGTGKTPHVEYLIRLLQYQHKVATMSRGYKRRTQGFLLANAESNALRIGDEPMQYHLKFPELAVCVAEERMTGIPMLLQRRPEVEVILLDDAYQHRSVKPGINILITDYARPFYTDYILPYGRLRESRKAYLRADIILVSKCPVALAPDAMNIIRERIAPAPHQRVYFTAIHYAAPYDFFTNEKTCLSGKQALVVCGIAVPEPLVAHITAEASGVHVLSYPDHHYFLSGDLEEIKTAYDAWKQPDKVIVTTEKDAARLHLLDDTIRAWNIPVIVLPIDVSFLADGEQFDRQINDYVAAELSFEDEGGGPMVPE